MRDLSFVLTLLLIFILAGCGSTKSGSQDPSDQEFTYKTNLVPANFGLSSDSFTGPVKILFQARTQCKGVNCVPHKVELTFSRQSISNTLYLSNRNLSIHAGKESYGWKGVQRTTIYETQPVGGIIKTVPLEWNEFIQIATAPKVTGNLSGENFEWTYQNRKTLRKLLSEIESKSTEDN